MNILATILKFIGDIFVGIFNNGMKTEGESHEVKEIKTEIDDKSSINDLIDEFSLHDRHKKED